MLENGARFKNERFVSPAKRRRLEEIMCGQSKNGVTSIGFGPFPEFPVRPSMDPLHPGAATLSLISPAPGRIPDSRKNDSVKRTGQLSGRKRKIHGSIPVCTTPGASACVTGAPVQGTLPWFHAVPTPGYVATGKENAKDVPQKVLHPNPTRGTSKDPTPWVSRSKSGLVSPRSSEHERQLLIEREAKISAREEELTAKYKSKLEELKNKEYSMNQEHLLLSQQLEHMHQQYDSMSHEFSKLRERDQQARDVIISLLKEKEQQERKDRERKVVEDNKRIGRVVWVRQNNFQMQEAWEDGEVFMQMKRQSKEMQRDKENLDTKRKILKDERGKLNKAAKKKEKEALLKDRRSADKDGLLKDCEKSNSPEFETPNPKKLDELTIQGEVYNMRHQELKKKFAALEEKSSNLQYQKKRHIRFLRLCRDEKASKFKDNPILNDRYLLMNLLGKGGFSEVYRAYDLQEHMYVACKIHQLNSNWADERKRNYTKHATREYEIHKTLCHARCVKLYDVFGIDTHAFATVLELCDGVDMDMYLKIHKTIPEREARCLVMQLFSALKYFAEQGKPVIHYDLKPGNLLRLSDGSVKVTDFGLSKIMESQGAMSEMELTSQGAGTYWYLPPECFRTDSPKISVKVDVWSAGVIFFQMLYGRRPFGHDLSQKLILQQQTILKSKEVIFPSQPKVSQEAKNFISRCLMQNPADRPNPCEVLDTDPYFAPVRKKGKP